MKFFLDRIYPAIRPFRFLYGWAKDARTKARCNARAEEWKAKGFNGAKLDICGGRYPYNPSEFLNVDIVDLPAVDLVFDIRERFPIDDNMIVEIVSFATLEHFRKHHNEHIVREFYRVLQPGGTVRIATPNIEAIAQGVLAGDNLDDLNQQLFGRFKSGDTEDYDLHRWMYPPEAMMELLRSVGFRTVEQIPMEARMHDPKYNFLIRAEK